MHALRTIYLGPGFLCQLIRFKMALPNKYLLSSSRRGRGHNGAEHNKYFEIREVHRLSTYHCRSVAVCVWNHRSSTWLLLDRVWMLWYLVWSLGRLICAFRTLIFFCVNSITQAKVIFPLTTDRKSIHKAVCARYKPTRRRQRTL